MRNGNKTRQLLSLARIFVLALCFTLVFAVAISVTPDGYFDSAKALNADSSDTNVRVYQKDGYENATTYVVPDNYQLSAFNTDFESIMGYGKNGGNSKTEWNIGEITFVNATYGLRTNITYNSELGRVKSGDGDNFEDKLTIDPLPAADGGGLKMSFPIEAQFWGDLTSADSVSAVFNIAIPQYLTSLLRNEEFKITFNAQIDVSKGESGGGYQRACAKIATSPKKVSAIVDSDMDYTAANKGGNKKGDYGYKYNSTSKGSWTNSTISFTDITLNSANPNLYFCVGIGETVGKCTVSFRNLKLTNVKIVREVKADSDSIERVDGASPVNKAQYDNTVQDSFYPYNTNASTAGGWAVWHDNITSQLSKKIDNVTYGNGKLQSYTNSPIATIGGQNYYKTSTVTYHDTYNYLPGLMGYIDSGDISQGFTTETLKYVCECGYVYTGTNFDSLDNSYTCPNCGKSKSAFTKTINVPSKMAQDIDINYASGIKQVIVGSKYREEDADDTTGGTLAAVFNLYDANSYGENHGKGIYVEGQLVGWAVVTKTNRAEVVVKTYMYTNARVATQVMDYGFSSNSWNIEYSGIDTTAPDDNVNSGTNVSLDKFVGTNAQDLAWLRQNKITADGSIEIREDDTAAGYSPYLWFYTVNRADSLAELNNIAITQFADYAAVKAAGINPIAYGEISSFTYDFANGVAKAYGGADQGNPASITDNVTGHGYYRFTFYIFDLAGNKGGVKSFYTKVDYDRPEYTVDYSFDKNGVQTTILASENGKWATGDVTLKFTLTAGGFSGYTFRFEDANGAMHAIVVNGMGDYEGDSYIAGIANYITSASGTATTAVSNDITININGVDVNVAYAVDEGGNGTFTFTIPTPATAFFEWISTFSMFCGQYASINAIDIDEQSVEYINNDWKGGIKVLIDGIAPTVPLFEDEEGYLSTFENYELPSSRNWFTTSYNLPVMLAFNDAITATDYASGLKIHYGIKAVKNLTELLAYRDINVENNYKSAIDIQKELGFDRYIMATGDALDGDATDFELQLLQNLNAGMRLIYVWAEDQAGNVSELSRYFVLVDANNYSVSASVKSNAKLESGFANLTFTNAEGVAVTTIKRGETLLFNVGLANSYVPFKFTQNGNVLFENYTQNQVWSGISNENAQYITASGYETLQVTLDDFNNLTDLEKSNRFELSARKVVTYNYINSSVGYTAAPTDVSSAVVIPEYESAKSSFVYRFVDAENNLLYVKDDGETTIDVNEAARDTSGNPVYFVPTKVGDYYVRIYIPKENDSFITKDFAMNEGGEQLFKARAYNIIRGKAVITVKSSTSKFGESASSVLGMLDFDVTGIDKAQMASEKIFVNLVLKDVTLASGETYRVGNYAIVNQSGDYSAATNYDVTFNSAIHTVTRRQVTIDAWSASKAFGDSDPEFRFGVELAQFAGLYKSANEIVADVFSAYNPVTDTTADGYALFYAGGSISRESAEGVGQYDFASDASLFDIDSNYSIVVQTTKYKFTIEKRIVKLDVSGQSSVFPFGTTVESEISKIAPTYKIAAKDMVVASQIEALFANGAKLSLGAKIAELTEEDYSAVYKYAIVLGGTLDDGNVVIELDASGAEYIVYVTKQNAIVVKVKDGVNFEFVYGFVWGENTLVFDSEKFELQGTPSGEYTSVKWSVDVANGTILDAGKRILSISGAKLYNGETALEDAVFVEPVTVTINPATIVVKPTAQNFSKVYGEEDGVYGIGFDVASVGGQAIAKDGSYANVAYNDILAQINGVFVRAIFDKNGNRLSFASRYDGATDASGTVYGTDGRYYGFAVGTPFSTQNSNFKVEAAVDSTQKLAIEQKSIDLSTKYFVGIGKAYDGKTDVFYNGTNLYDLSSYLVLATDDVTLVANANYDSPEKGIRSIVFDAFSLSGAQALNYRIANFVNDGNSTQVNGSAAKDTVAIDDSTFVTIIYIDNIDGKGNIIISAGVIALLKSDVTISKQYDNTKDLGVSSVSFASGEGTKSLITADKFLITEESDSFTGTEVNSNYVVNVALFFVIDKPEEFDIKRDGIYENSDIVIDENAMYNNRKGIKIVLKNMPASIKQRVLGTSSFQTLDAVDRDYNKKTDVDMTYTFAQGALAEGDTAQTIGLKLAGKAANANAGTHSVRVSGYSVLDKNYYVDVDALNTAYTDIGVVISKARLVPNVKFADKTYDGTSNVVADNVNGTFTSVQYATNLEEELKKFSYDASKVSFMLSLNGAEDENVGANGKHNVLVSGLEVRFDGTDTDILKNYVLEGARYSKVDDKYNKINSLQVGAIDDFELIDAVNMSKKQIQLIVNDFDIKDKIYDGTTSASITINITDGRIVAGHSDLLEVVASGNFARKQTGKNIAIDVSVATLQIKNSLSQEQYDLALEAIDNYELVQYKGTITGNIEARPVLVSADLGTREYNGDEAVVKSNISYTFKNMIDADKKFYAIQTKNGAYFIDKNVAIDKDGNVIAKDGTAYGLLLQNIKEKYDNYTLVYSNNSEIAGKKALAFVMADGTIVYEKPAEAEIAEYWYALETTDKYILKNDTASVEEAQNANAIVGFYKVDGVDAYLIASDYAGETSKLVDAINYLPAQGKITQRTASIRASGIERATDTDAFEKTYDGTDIFFGQVGVDFNFSTSAVSNVIIGDDVTIANVSAKFDSAYATAKYVVFTASGIAGADAYNYTIAGEKTSVEVKLSGRIKARSINAYLADDEAEYGVSTGKFTGKVTYKLVGNDGVEYALDNQFANDTAFYISMSDFLAATGLDASNATLLAGVSYDLADGKYVKAAEGAIGGYVRMGEGANDKISTLPQAYVSFAATTPEAGTTSTSYVLKGGRAKNYDFKPVYTDKGSVSEANGTTSKVSVVKKNLYVLTVSNAYSANYGDVMSADGKLLFNVGLRYLDKNGNDGIIGGQSVNTLFAKDRTNFFPTVRLGVYNENTGVTTPATQLAKISDKLESYEHYVLYVVSDYDYDAVDTIVRNYNVVLAGIDTISARDNDGQVRTIFDIAGANAKFDTATLEIVLPKLTGVSVGSDTQNEFSYSYAIDKTGNGINRLHEVVQGELETDEVIFVDDEGNELYPINVGTYSGIVKVRRYINANGQFVARKDVDANGYYIEWNSGSVKKSIVIDKADVGLRAQNVSEYYNGAKHEYATAGGENRISYNNLTNGYNLVKDADFTLTYQVLKDGKYVTISANEVVNAGKYRVIVALTDKFLASECGKNYNAASTVAELQVLRAIVNVTFSSDGYAMSEEMIDGSTVMKLTGDFVEGKNYSVGYEVAMASASNAPAIAIDKSQTKLVGLEGIKSAGKYSFAVVLSDDTLSQDNYVFMSSTGVLELTAKSLASSDGSSINITEGKGVVANRLEVKEIKTNNALASDMSYLKAVEQYVAAMSQKAGVKDASVAAVLRVNLYLDDQLVLLSNTPTTVTVALPESVKNLNGIAIYYVNENGGLTKLTDYVVNDGKLTYSANYVNGIVFVDVNHQSLDAWKIYVIVAAVVIVTLIVVATVVTIVVKKSKLKKLA